MSVVNEIMSQAKHTANKERNDKRMKRETNREWRERDVVGIPNELESIEKRVKHLRATVRSWKISEGSCNSQNHGSPTTLQASEDTQIINGRWCGTDSR